MNRGRSRWLIRLAVVLIVGLAALLWTVRRGERNFTVENRSGQTIKLLQVTVAGESSTFHDVPNKSEVLAPGKLQGQDSFSVDGRLADGGHIRVSGRIADSTHFLILPNGECKFRSAKE